MPYDPFAATNAGMQQPPPQDPFMATNMGQAQPSWPMQPPMRQMGVPTPGPVAGGQGQIDPALAAQVIALNRTAVDQAKVNRQLKMADALRGAAPGMMESRSPINTPNWAGALAGAASGLRANYLEGKAQQGLEDIVGKRTGVYDKYFGAMG